jgi:hypothetical protein
MKKRNLTLSLTFLLIAVLGISGIMADLWRQSIEVETLPGAAGSITPGRNPPEVKPNTNGVIETNEYVNHKYDDETGLNLYWTIMEDRIFLALSSPGHGWVAVGIDPDGPMMRGADIWIGYVRDDNVVIKDHYGDTPVSHKMDTEAGGNHDLLAVAGSENEQGTVLEFERLLSTDDEFDKPIPQDERFIQLAYGEQDDTSTYHAKRSVLPLNFYQTEVAKP